MRLITSDDIKETYFKIHQRGIEYILSKFTFKANKRVTSTWNNNEIVASNWWNIPKVRSRWNYLITGNEKMTYEEYFVEHFVKNSSSLKLLSLGCGNCSHELKLAKNKQFTEITCIDLSDDLLKTAEKTAIENNLQNIRFEVADANKYAFPDDHFDVILFNMSLHHFKNIDVFVGQNVKKSLKENGKLVINEFVGATRLQFEKTQIKAINKSLKLIPTKYRKRYKTGITKTKISGPGILRMLVTDPSECIDSNSIMPTIKQNYTTLFEKPYGGNLLMTVLKDISHHFITLTPETEEILQNLFDYEDEYIKKNPSDFIFGVYGKKNN